MTASETRCHRPLCNAVDENIAVIRAPNDVLQKTGAVACEFKPFSTGGRFLQLSQLAKKVEDLIPKIRRHP
jgi:hypothetical protein